MHETPPIEVVPRESPSCVSSLCCLKISSDQTLWRVLVAAVVSSLPLSDVETPMRAGTTGFLLKGPGEPAFCESSGKSFLPTTTPSSSWFSFKLCTPISDLLFGIDCGTMWAIPPVPAILGLFALNAAMNCLVRSRLTCRIAFRGNRMCPLSALDLFGTGKDG